MSETLINTHRGARDPDRFRIPRVAAMLRGDAVDYDAMRTLSHQKAKGPYGDSYQQWRNFALLSFARVDL